MKTLYVTDLDGTLLTPEQSISDFSANNLNRLIKNGMMFSYATARSLYTSGKIMKKVTAEFPVIIYNGVFIADSRTGKRLKSHFFNRDEFEQILSVLEKRSVSPIIYSLDGDREFFSYIQNQANTETLEFISTRENDIRHTPSDSFKHIDENRAFYFTCIDRLDKLLAVYEELKGSFYCVQSKDIYSSNSWLEILPKGVNKASAIKELKNMLGAQEIVSFGDAINDLPMFEISDRCYAVGNADQRLKTLATGIIAPNTEDGVVKWLLENTGY